MLRQRSLRAALPERLHFTVFNTAVFKRKNCRWSLARNRRHSQADRMNWSNVKLIVVREIRDQLRDRRTMLLVAVLTVVSFPLMGMSFLQLTQFMHEREIRVLVLGAPINAELPPL